MDATNKDADVHCPLLFVNQDKYYLCLHSTLYFVDRGIKIYSRDIGHD